MVRTVNPKALRDPKDILYLVNGAANSWEEVLGACNGRESTAKRMLDQGLLREVPGHPGLFAGTHLGRWFYQFIDTN